MSEIIINIDEANKAKKYDDTGLFQVEAFERVKSILDNHSYNEKESDNIVDCRFHDTVFIDGGRGVGKTAFMLNIKNYYENPKNQLEKKSEKKYLFLDPVDPTLLEHTEKFLSVVLARIVEKVNDSNNNNNIEPSSEYFKSLEELSKSLSAIKTLPDDLGIEEIASNKSSLKLEQHAHTFFKEVKNIFKVDGLVMLIDDIDMAFDKGFDVLEVVRKYLASPYLIPIVAGDMKLYKEIVETHFMDKIKFSDDVKHLKAIYEGTEIKNSDEYKAKQELLNNLIEQYLHKIFPNEYHIQLKDIFTILKENPVSIKFENDSVVPYKDLKDFEIRLINWGINQKEFTQQIFTNNTRDFVQYIYNKREIFSNAFRSYKSENYPEEKDKKPFIISNRLDKLIKEKVIDTPKVHKESLKLTADFYRYSNDIDKKRLSLLLDNDVKAFTNDGYSIYNALKGSFFIYEISPYNKIDKEIIRDKLDLPKERYEKIENRTEAEYLALYLMFHDNYYSNKTSKYLFITGKLIESIFCILDRTIKSKAEKEEKIERLNFDIPYLAGIEKNKYIPKLSQEKGSNVRLKLENINYSSFIDLFKNSTELHFTSLFLHEMLKKYINNINILKAGSYSRDTFSIDQDVNSIILITPIFDTVKRVFYIFLNSLASFESRQYISTENIALDGEVDNMESYSKAFLNNIANIEDNTLTKYLYELFSKSIFNKKYEENNENSIFTKGYKSDTFKKAKEKTSSQIYNLFDNRAYSKFFKNNTYKDEQKVQDIYTIYLELILNIYENELVYESEKKEALELLANKTKKFDKVFHLISTDMAANIEFESNELVKKYKEIVYNS